MALYGFGHLQALTDEQQKREAQAGILVLIKMTRDPILDSLSELEEELRAVDLANKRRKDIEFIREALATDLDKPTLPDFGVLYINFMKAVGLFNALKEELLNRKCEDLFNVYLTADAEN